MGSNGLLQRLSQARTDDVADLLGLEQGDYGLAVEAAVGAKQAHFSSAQIFKGGLNKTLGVVVEASALWALWPAAWPQSNRRTRVASKRVMSAWEKRAAPR